MLSLQLVVLHLKCHVYSLKLSSTNKMLSRRRRRRGTAGPLSPGRRRYCGRRPVVFGADSSPGLMSPLAHGCAWLPSLCRAGTETVRLMRRSHRLFINGRGPPRSEKGHFRDKHRPWQRGHWTHQGHWAACACLSR